MALLTVPLAQITERDLMQLIDAKAAEARDIEYKREGYGDSDGDRAEWLADVSSFANTAGGDLILGIDAKDGVPLAIRPLTVNVDQEILRLEQIARSNLQPRIAHLEFKRIPISAGGEVLLVRIARSYNAPHRIVRTGKGQNRFWARSSAGKYEPNVEELRALFNLAPQLVDRIRDFRAQRVARIAADGAPVKLVDRPRLVLHMVPFASLDPGAPLLSLPAIEQHPHAFAPMGSRSGSQCRINFEGALIPSNANSSAPVQRAYMQVYRTGQLETVASSITRGGEEGSQRRLTSLDIEGMVLTTLVRAVKGLAVLGVGAPFAVMVSLLGLRGLPMLVGGRSEWALDDQDDISVLAEDQYHFAEVILETVPQNIQEAGRMLRPFIEQLANMAGKSASSSFGPNGDYLHAFQ